MHPATNTGIVGWSCDEHTERAGSGDRERKHQKKRNWLLCTHTASKTFLYFAIFSLNYNVTFFWLCLIELFFYYWLYTIVHVHNLNTSNYVHVNCAYSIELSIIHRIPDFKWMNKFSTSYYPGHKIGRKNRSV